MINPPKKVKKSNFLIKLAGAGAVIRIYGPRSRSRKEIWFTVPQHWQLIINDEFFVPLQGSVKHLRFTSVPFIVFHVRYLERF